jgi:signal transduction histidine kinase
VHLDEIVKQVVMEQAATSPLHQIQCHIEPSETPYLVSGDRARLLQVLTNLLQNAVKYSPIGGPVAISLSQTCSQNEDGNIKVQIQDTGIGIPSEAQEHLFERFYRAPNSTGSSTKGIGLGLYVVAEFVHLHDGTIHVESNGIPGEGSRFILTFPILR